MTSFQKKVIITSSVLLAIGLFIIWGLLKYRKEKEQWPPIVANCPDYMDDIYGDGTSCMNPKNLGTCGNDAMNFTTNTFSSPCDKSKYVKNCNLSWDGIQSLCSETQ